MRYQARLLLAGLALAFAPSTTVALPQSVSDLVRKAMIEGIPNEAAAVDLVERLIQLGPAGAPELLSCATQGIALGNRGRAALPGLVQVAVVESLGQLPRLPVREAMLAVALGEAPASLRQSTISILATIGDAEDVPLLLVLTDENRGDGKIPRDLRSSLRSALLHIGERDPATPRAIQAELSRVSSALLNDLVAGIAGSRDRDARRELAYALGLRTEADALLFSELEKLVRDFGRPADQDLERYTLNGLSSDSPQARMQAARLAQALDLVSAVPLLLICSTSTDQLERRASSMALGAILHTAQPANGSAWIKWAEEEQTWWNGQGATLLNGLASEEPARVAYAIRGLAHARLHREELVPWIIPNALDGTTGIQTLAVVALGNLGGRAAEDTLIQVLEDFNQEQRLAEACVEGLERATGLQLGDNPQVWRTVLEIQRR